MNVMEGVSYERSDGSWQKIEVEVGDGDFEKFCASQGVEPEIIGVLTKHQALAVLAEMMVFERMKQTRVHDEAWVSSEMPEMKKQIMARFVAAVGKLKEAQ